MTEEDTFNCLRRPPVDVMYNLWMDCPIMDWNCKDAFDFFIIYGWTRDSFEEAHRLATDNRRSNDRR